MTAKRQSGRGRRCASAAALLALVLAGCASEPSLPDLDEIYDEVSALGDGTDRRPLIAVPGTLGSRLVDAGSGTVIWGGGSRGLSADPDDAREAKLIALPIIAPGAPISAIADGIRPDGILDVAPAEIFGIPISIDVYGGTKATFSAGGFRVQDEDGVVRGPPAGLLGTGDDAGDGVAAPSGAQVAMSPVEAAALEAPDSAVFRYAYDWRRDLPTLAAEFHRYVIALKRRVAAARSETAGRTVRPEEVTFDLLAHSMGGLMTRYYLMHGPAELPEDGTLPPVTWEGARHFSRVVFVAPPNSGSIVAMDNLVNGKDLGPLQPEYPGWMLATHPSAWQLFPRARHRRLSEAGDAGAPLDPLDPDLWAERGWALAAPAAEEFIAWMLPDVGDPQRRRALVLAHQARLMRRARQFHRALDRWAPTPSGLELFLVVGGGFRTPANAELSADGAFELTDEEEGDGVVLRASVLLDERQGREVSTGLRTPLRFDTVLFLPDEHVELTKNPVFGDNLLFWLLEKPRDVGALARPSGAGLLSGSAIGGETRAPAPRSGPVFAPGRGE